VRLTFVAKRTQNLNTTMSRQETTQSTSDDGPKFADEIPRGKSVNSRIRRRQGKKSVNRVGKAVAVNKTYEQRQQEKAQLAKVKELENQIKKEMQEEREQELRKIKQRREAKLQALMLENRLKKQAGINKKKTARKTLTPEQRKRVLAYQFYLANNGKAGRS
jgi:hypothetical protein